MRRTDPADLASMMWTWTCVTVAHGNEAQLVDRVRRAGFNRAAWVRYASRVGFVSRRARSRVGETALARSREAPDARCRDSHSSRRGVEGARSAPATEQRCRDRGVPHHARNRKGECRRVTRRELFVLPRLRELSRFDLAATGNRAR